MKARRTLRSLGEGGWKGFGEFRKDTSELCSEELHCLTLNVERYRCDSCREGKAAFTASCVRLSRVKRRKGSLKASKLSTERLNWITQIAAKNSG